MLLQGRNDKDFCMPPILEVERRHYLLKQAGLADETFGSSLLVSISEAYHVWGIIFRYWRNAKPACYCKDEMTMHASYSEGGATPLSFEPSRFGG
jgi:hypothetical protein